MNRLKKDNSHQVVKTISDILMKNYWGPIFHYVKENQGLLNTIAGFLLEPEVLTFYLGKTHLGIEYYGPERIPCLNEYGKKIDIKFYDYTSHDDFIEKIIGFKFEDSKEIFNPMPLMSEDLIFPTKKGLDKLIDLKWDFFAQNALIGFNLGSPRLHKGEFHRLINARFFDSDENGLKTRHIKWIDFFPLVQKEHTKDEVKLEIDLNYYNRDQMVVDANYTYPLPDKTDFKYSKLYRINRFIEMIGDKNNSEPQITKFLSDDENRFILTMAFAVKEIYPEKECEWQSEEKKPVKPDFFIENTNGYTDIVEFKLPYLKSKTIVGSENRSSFSAEMNSYISQIRTYSEYFNDPNNRKWVQEKYGINVYYPKRKLVVGRRFDFSHEEWRKIVSEYNNVEIITYDDLIDRVRVQLYK